jgi:hypothetical protein
VQLGVVEEGAGLLVGGVAGVQLTDLLPPLHPLPVDPAQRAITIVNSFVPASKQTDDA